MFLEYIFFCFGFGFEKCARSLQFPLLLQEYFRPFAEIVIYIYLLKLFRQIALNKFYQIVSNALDRSMNIIPTFLSLSRACFHSSIIFSKAFCVMRFLRNPLKCGRKKKIYLVEDYSFKYLRCMGKNTTRR